MMKIQTLSFRAISKFQIKILKFQIKLSPTRFSIHCMKFVYQTQGINQILSFA